MPFEIPESCLALLPRPVALQQREFHDKRGDLHAAVLRAADRRNDSIRRRGERKARLAHLSMQSRLGVPVTQEQFDALERAIAEDEAEAERLAAVHDALSQKFQDHARLVTACGEALESCGYRCDLLASVALDLVPGEPFNLALDRERAAVAACKQRIAETEEKPRAKAEAVAEVRKFCADASVAGTPDVAGLLEASPSRIRWPMRTEVVYVAGQGHVPLPVPDLAAALAWLDPKGFEAALLREVAEAADDRGDGITTEARRRLLAELKDELFSLERREEAIIRAAAAEGLDLPRRGDADPWAVMDCQPGRPPEQVPSVQAVPTMRVRENGTTDTDVGGWQ